MMATRLSKLLVIGAALVALGSAAARTVRLVTAIDHAAATAAPPAGEARSSPEQASRLVCGIGKRGHSA